MIWECREEDPFIAGQPVQLAGYKRMEGSEPEVCPDGLPGLCAFWPHGHGISARNLAGGSGVHRISAASSIQRRTEFLRTGLSGSDLRRLGGARGQRLLRRAVAGGAARS